MQSSIHRGSKEGKDFRGLYPKKEPATNHPGQLSRLGRQKFPTGESTPLEKESISSAEDYKPRSREKCLQVKKKGKALDKL